MFISCSSFNLISGICNFLCYLLCDVQCCVICWGLERKKLVTRLYNKQTSHALPDKNKHNEKINNYEKLEELNISHCVYCMWRSNEFKLAPKKLSIMKLTPGICSICGLEKLYVSFNIFTLPWIYDWSICLAL